MLMLLEAESVFALIPDGRFAEMFQLASTYQLKFNVNQRWNAYFTHSVELCVLQNCDQHTESFSSLW